MQLILECGLLCGKHLLHYLPGGKSAFSSKIWEMLKYVSMLKLYKPYLSEAARHCHSGWTVAENDLLVYSKLFRFLGELSWSPEPFRVCLPVCLPSSFISFEIILGNWGPKTEATVITALVCDKFIQPLPRSLSLLWLSVPLQSKLSQNLLTRAWIIPLIWYIAMDGQKSMPILIFPWRDSGGLFARC